MAEATDVVLVGGGIMSATLGVLLKELEPSWEITLIERLEDVALESSNAWNNAGTGHSALCELASSIRRALSILPNSFMSAANFGRRWSRKASWKTIPSSMPCRICLW